MAEAETMADSGMMMMMAGQSIDIDEADDAFQSSDAADREEPASKRKRPGMLPATIAKIAEIFGFGVITCIYTHALVCGILFMAFFPPRLCPKPGDELKCPTARETHKKFGHWSFGYNDLFPRCSIGKNISSAKQLQLLKLVEDGEVSELEFDWWMRTEKFLDDFRKVAYLHEGRTAVVAVVGDVANTAYEHLRDLLPKVISSYKTFDNMIVHLCKDSTFVTKAVHPCAFLVAGQRPASAKRHATSCSVINALYQHRHESHESLRDAVSEEIRLFHDAKVRAHKQLDIPSDDGHLLTEHAHLRSVDFTDESVLRGFQALRDGLELPDFLHLLTKHVNAHVFVEKDASFFVYWYKELGSARFKTFTSSSVLARLGDEVFEKCLADWREKLGDDAKFATFLSCNSLACRLGDTDFDALLQKLFDELKDTGKFVTLISGGSVSSRLMDDKFVEILTSWMVTLKPKKCVTFIAGSVSVYIGKPGFLERANWWLAKLGNDHFVTLMACDCVSSRIMTDKFHNFLVTWVDRVNTGVHFYYHTFHTVVVELATTLLALGDAFMSYYLTCPGKWTQVVLIKLKKAAGKAKQELVADDTVSLDDVHTTQLPSSMWLDIVPQTHEQAPAAKRGGKKIQRYYAWSTIEGKKPYLVGEYSSVDKANDAVAMYNRGEEPPPSNAY